MEKWFKTVPDEPKIDYYAIWVAAEDNTIVKQAGYSLCTSPASGKFSS